MSSHQECLEEYYTHCNVYSNPEHHGLTFIDSIDYSSTGNYEFDYRVVWRGDDSIYYTGRDGGCSCPSPFEDYRSIKDLDVLDLAQLALELNALSHGEYANVTKKQTWDFLVIVTTAVAGKVKPNIDGYKEMVWALEGK